MMYTTTLKKRMLSGRVVSVTLATTIALGATVATATTASAQTCRPVPNSHNICFSIDSVGNNDYRVHIGIDVQMSREDAEAILAPTGNEVWAKLYGDDWSDNFLKHVPLSWVTAWDGGLSAEFDGVVDGCVLNEDWGDDEVYGRVFMYDHRSGGTRTFDTNVIKGDYHC